MGIHFSWYIDSDNAEAYFKVTAETTGWVGMGIGEAGGMRGADLMIGR